MKVLYEDFSNICRICLCNANLNPLISLRVINVYKTFTNIEIIKDDGLPQNICEVCVSQLEKMSVFVDTCKNNEALLKRVYSEFKKERDVYETGNDSDNNQDLELEPSLELTEEVLIKTEAVNKVNTNLKLKTEKKYSEKTINSKSLKSRGERKCPMCAKEVSKGGFKKHYTINPKCRPSDCRCPVCGKTFYPRNKLAIHLKSHRKDTPYKCPECSKKFAFAENLRRHALIHKGVKPFICVLCEKGFLRKRSLDEHMNFHTGTTPYICSYCGKGFRRLTDHASHIYRTHNVNIEEIPKLKRKYTEKRVHLNLECKICGKYFASRSGYANHQLIHNGIKKFLCNICGRKFITNPTLQSHIRTHTGETPFDCKECGRSFRQRNALSLHMSHHITDKSMNCPQCDKKYFTKNALNKHISTHTNAPPLECLKCKKTFSHKHTLQTHILKIHIGEKPNECSLCKKSFVSPSHLRVHLRTHSGEKPYFCPVCGKQLAQPQTLKVHMRQHTGETPYVCPVCDRGFHDSSNLKRHVNRNHGTDDVKKDVLEEENKESDVN